MLFVTRSRESHVVGIRGAVRGGVDALSHSRVSRSP